LANSAPASFRIAIILSFAFAILMLHIRVTFAAPSSLLLSPAPDGNIHALKPTLRVSPTCGPLSGFSIHYYANGFAPDGIVYWQLIHSNGVKTVGPFGTFATNRTGGFNQTTFIEDLPSDRYTLSAFDDIDKDGKFNPGEANASTKITIPCAQHPPA
jgi:hypothetical protein